MEKAARFCTNEWVGIAAVVFLALLSAPPFVGCSSSVEEPSLEYGNQDQVSVFASYPPLVVEELLISSDIVVYGEVLSYSDPMLIDPVSDADPLYHTDMYVKVGDVYQGSPRMSETYEGKALFAANEMVVAVRIKGGGDEGIEVPSSSSPGLSVGEEGIFFLYRIADGADYNTEGNHYYLAAGPSSVWKKVGNGQVEASIYGMTEEVELSEAEGAIRAARANLDSGSVGVDIFAYSGVRSSADFVSKAQERLKAGEATQAEVDEALAQYELAKNSYARIL